MSTFSKASFIVLGCTSLICSIFGLIYNIIFGAVSFSGTFDDLIKSHGLVYFYPSFYLMFSITIACYLLLAVCGFYFIRYRPLYTRVFLGLLAFEVAYFLSFRFIVQLPKIGGSVAAASGVANGGLMAQFFILFPIWGAFLSVLARKRLNEGAQEKQQIAKNI